MVKHRMWSIVVVMLSCCVMGLFQEPVSAQNFNASSHVSRSSTQTTPPFFKDKHLKKIKPAKVKKKVKLKSLNKNQEQLLIEASPNSVSEIQFFGLTDEELAMNYDWYDYNILRAFQKHSLNPLKFGFTAVKVVDGQGQYVNASYTARQIRTMSTLMDDFSRILSNARTDRQKVEAIVQYVSDRLQYSGATAISAEQSGDLIAQGLYIGDLQSNYVAAPQADFGGALEAYNVGGGVCQEYSELTQLGFLYAGIQTVIVDNVTQELISGANTTGDTSYLHAWNEIELEGEWYGSDSTWTDIENPNAYDTDWEVFTQSQSLANDFYINDPSFELTNYPLHTATANAQALIN